MSRHIVIGQDSVAFNIDLFAIRHHLIGQELIADKHQATRLSGYLLHSSKTLLVHHHCGQFGRNVCVRCMYPHCFVYIFYFVC